MPVKKRTENDANIVFYQGDYQEAFDCVGEQNCKYAQSYVSPPEPDFECVWKRSCNCSHCEMCRNTLIALAAKIADRIKELSPDE